MCKEEESFGIPALKWFFSNLPSMELEENTGLKIKGWDLRLVNPIQLCPVAAAITSSIRIHLVLNTKQRKSVSLQPHYYVGQFEVE